MRRRLEGVEEEYDLKVNELQGDISSLRNILQQTEVHTKQAEREKSLLITQLTEQNQRLTSQLKDVSRKENILWNSEQFFFQSSRTEESLTVELQSMRDQVYNKKTSMSDHVQILETLREEITIMTERKIDLERRIEVGWKIVFVAGHNVFFINSQALYAEREGLSSTLDESADRIVMLEKEARERDCLVSLDLLDYDLYFTS